MKIDDIIFIDFEASGLSPHSWPIEAGLAWIVDRSVQSWSTLIQPHDGWHQEGWSEHSATVHGISRRMLDAAPSACDVAHELADRFRGKVVVSDDPEQDHSWAATLMACIDGPVRQIADFDAAVGTFCGKDPAAVSAVYQSIEVIRAPHRAGPDAARLATAILKGLEVATGRLPD